MEEKNIIHVIRGGPYTVEEARAARDDATDYGSYQIYGTHPVYGSSVLLYIGRTDRQTFGVRLSQEKQEDTTIWIPTTPDLSGQARRVWDTNG